MESKNAYLFIGLLVLVLVVALGLATQYSGQLKSQALVTDINPIDITGDGIVSNDDLRAVANAWETTPGDPNYSAIVDLNSDGIINHADAEAISQAWTLTP